MRQVARANPGPPTTHRPLTGAARKCSIAAMVHIEGIPAAAVAHTPGKVWCQRGAKASRRCSRRLVYLAVSVLFVCPTSPVWAENPRGHEIMGEANRLNREKLV